MELHLPIAVPFVNGSPANYKTMSTEQLKNFINFLYRSSCNEELPVGNSRSYSQSGKPDWWSSSISFERDLILKIDNICLYSKEKHRKELSQLVYKYYKSLGIPSLIAFVGELSEIKHLLQYEHSGDQVNLVNKVTGKTLIVVSRDNHTYDIQTNERKEDLNVSKNTLESESSKKQPKLAGKSSTSVLKKCTEQPVKRTEFKYIYSFCKYCHQTFRFHDKEFLEDHEKKCSKRPLEPTLESSSSDSSPPNKLEFMNALGLFSNIGKTTDSKEYSEMPPPATFPSLPSLTKAQKKKRLAQFTKSRIVPLTSCTGQKILNQLGGIVKKYPPPYDKIEQPRKQYRHRLSTKVLEEEYDSVTKRKIIKDGLNPHIYSFGRRQRVERYQELVIGYKKSSWKNLNALKKFRLVMKKMKDGSKEGFKETPGQPTLALKSHVEPTARAAI